MSKSSHSWARTNPFIERVYTSASEVRTGGPQIAVGPALCREMHYLHVRVPEKAPHMSLRVPVRQWVLSSHRLEVDDPARPSVSRQYQRMSGLWWVPEDYCCPLDRSALDPSLSMRCKDAGSASGKGSTANKTALRVLSRDMQTTITDLYLTFAYAQRLDRESQKGPYFT